MEKTREQYIEEALRIMQDVEEVADLLEDRDEAEKVYMRGKSVLASNIINQLYLYLTDEDKAELASYLAKDIDTKQQAEIGELRNKVSELTEALDAAHIFCEGVKEHYTKKACEWVEEWMRRSTFIDGIKEELTK